MVLYYRQTDRHIDKWFWWSQQAKKCNCWFFGHLGAAETCAFNIENTYNISINLATCFWPPDLLLLAVCGLHQLSTKYCIQSDSYCFWQSSSALPASSCSPSGTLSSLKVLKLIRTSPWGCISCMNYITLKQGLLGTRSFKKQCPLFILACVYISVS